MAPRPNPCFYNIFVGLVLADMNLNISMSLKSNKLIYHFDCPGSISWLTIGWHICNKFNSWAVVTVPAYESWWNWLLVWCILFGLVQIKVKSKCPYLDQSLNYNMYTHTSPTITINFWITLLASPPCSLSLAVKLQAEHWIRSSSCYIHSASAATCCVLQTKSFAHKW